MKIPKEKLQKEFNIAIIGCGAIGNFILKKLDDFDLIRNIYVLDHNFYRAKLMEERHQKAVAVQDLRSIIDTCKLVVEAASWETVETYSTLILTHGVDLMIMSSGVFADSTLFKKLTKLAYKNDCKLFIPSGAVGGLDALKSAKVCEVGLVELTTTKPIQSLVGSPYLEAKKIDITTITEPTLIFEGDALEAIQAFPKNINVAITLSLAGFGPEKTRVKIICDPTIEMNQHTLRVTGDFGEMECTLKNKPFPENPKTSYLAALSAVATIKKAVENLRIGT